MELFALSRLTNGDAMLGVVLAGVIAFAGYAIFRLATAQNEAQRMAALFKVGIAVAIGLLAGFTLGLRPPMP